MVLLDGPALHFSLGLVWLRAGGGLAILFSRIVPPFPGTPFYRACVLRRVNEWLQ